MQLIPLRTPADLHLAAAELARWEAIGLDTETTGLDPWSDRLRLVQLATPEAVYLLDADAFDDLGPLRALLEAPTPVKVLHHAKFDAKFLVLRYRIRLMGVFDTMIASQLLGTQDRQGHGLAALCRRWLDRDLDKSQQRSDWGLQILSEAQWRYAAEDAAVLLPLRDRLKAALLKAGLARVATLEFAVAPVLAQVEVAGVRLDAAAWLSVAEERAVEHRKLASSLATTLAAADRQLSMIPGVGGINLNSVPQVMRALTQLGIPVKDTDDLTLGQFATDHPVVAELLDYRHAAKALSSYGPHFLQHVHPVTGRIHAEFLQLGADTGRMAAINPNLQQIPNQERYRACFVPADGHKLIIADYSQIELRILAEVSGDTRLLHAFETGADLHKLTAARLFGLALESVSKAQRQAAKSLNFGIVYGMGPTGLANRLHCSFDEARQLISRYFEAYPQVRVWLQNAAQAAVDAGECWTLGGRRVRIGKPEAGDRKAHAAVERIGKNAPLQGTSADITKRALILLAGALDSRTAIVNVVHDEVVLESPTEIAQAEALVVEREMIAAGRYYLKHVPVTVEAGIADSWVK